VYTGLTTTGTVSEFNCFGSLSSFSFHSSCRFFTVSLVMAVSSVAQPLRCGSPPKVNQLAAETAEQPITIAAMDREILCMGSLPNPKVTRGSARQWHLTSAKPSWDAELYEARHAFVWQFGENLIELLDPKPGERILDLGCGPGQLTHKIAKRGAEVIGLDASAEMIGQARQNYPDLQFVLQDAAAMQFEGEFDAVFSNAALHWMLDAQGVARRVARALRHGGRFVAELGGKGNIAAIESAIDTVLARYYGHALPPRRTFYPSIGEYATVLETCRLEVRSALLFDRPTPLEGPEGMENWMRQFKWYYFEPLAPEIRNTALHETIALLRPALFRDARWQADYRRLRIVAVKT
jgi:trans-aconitate methyltransferase